METKAHVNLTLDPDLLKWIDMDRGQMPRSTFINQILSRIFTRRLKNFNWSEETAMADNDIAKGRVKKFKTASEAIKWLKS